MGFREWIIPQDRVFYDLLEHLGHLAEETILEFQRLAYEGDIITQRQKIKDLEHEADLVMAEVFARLAKTFITPIASEDIARLAHALDNVIDGVDDAAGRLVVYGIKKPTKEMVRFADILVEQVRELGVGINALRRPATMARHVLPHAAELHRLENAADAVLDEALRELVRGKDLLHIMKHKEIYEHLESATDHCEDVAVVLQDIVRKH